MANDQLTTYNGVGPDGNFSIDLPGWAREATQAKMLTQLRTMNKEFGNLPKNMETAVSNALKGNYKLLKDLNSKQKETTKNKKQEDKNQKQNQNKTQKAQEDTAKALFSNAQGIKELLDLTKNGNNSDKQGDGSLLDLASKVNPVAKMVNGLFNVVGGLAGVVKGILGVMTTFAGLTIREFFKAFNLLNKGLRDGTGMLVGSFTESAVNVARQAARAGLGLSEFLDALRDNSEEIRVLGTKGFVDLRNSVRDASDGFFDMGYQNEEITKLLGREISIRSLLGMRLDMAGKGLSEDVVYVGKRLQTVGAAAGMSIENLYAASKLSDETNSLIAARARNLGDDGISALQTSIRDLSLRMVALSPTFGASITEPLVNAMITGAVGLDQGFTDLVTVFPGLVDAFRMGRDEIASTGELSADGITNIIESLADTSDEEFDRAKMLALMTRNQTAIQAVNFASEARARKSLMDAINKESLTINSAATISSQAKIFFDLLKAPFETMVPNFIMSVLGVPSGKDANLAMVVAKFGEETQRFLVNLPLIGKAFEGDFFANLSAAVKAYFDDDSTAEDRKTATARINIMVADMISRVGTALGDGLRAGTIGQSIAKMFRDLFDDIIANIYESSGGVLMKESMMGVHLRKGNFREALEIDPIFGSNMMEQLEQDYIKMTENIMLDAGANLGASQQRRGFWEKALFGEVLDWVDIGKNLGKVFADTFNEDMPEDVKKDMMARLAERDQDFADLFNDSGFTDKSGNKMTPESFKSFITDFDGKIDFTKLQAIILDRDDANNKAAEKILSALFNDTSVMERIMGYSGDTSFETSGKFATVEGGRRAPSLKSDGKTEVQGAKKLSLTATDMVGFRHSVVSEVASYRQPLAAATVNSLLLENEKFLDMFKKEQINGKQVVQIDNDEFAELFGRYRKDDPRHDDASLPSLAPGMLDELFEKLKIGTQESADLKAQMNKLLMRIEDHS